MAVKVQHLRSSTANKRPTAANLLDGELSINTDAGTAGVFFENASGGIVKVGPAEVGATAPNASPPAGGSSGNSTGEFWLDTANAGGNAVQALKIYDGAAWDYIGSVTIGTTDIEVGSAGSTTLSGLTSISSTDITGTLQTASQTNITEIGTITTGTWNATAIGIAYGGTGLTSAPTDGQVLMGNAGNAYALVDFDTEVRTNRLDQMAAPTSDVSFNSVKITSLADPVSDTDAANKGYVDSVAQGLDVKGSCRLATAAALPTVVYNNGTSGVGATLTASAAGVLTVDGQATTLGERILVKNQSSQEQNGIYEVTTEGTAGVAFVLTRSTDMDEADEFPGAFTFIEEGTDNGDSGFVCTTNAPVTVGSTAITFDQFSGAGQITAGNGLNKTGNTLDVNVDGTTIEINGSDQVAIKSTYTGQTSITTLGTITTGTWNATAIGLTYGGTGTDNTSITDNYAFMGPNSGGPGNASFREILTSDIAPITGGSFDSGTY